MEEEQSTLSSNPVATTTTTATSGGGTGRGRGRGGVPLLPTGTIPCSLGARLQQYVFHINSIQCYYYTSMTCIAFGCQ